MHKCNWVRVVHTRIIFFAFALAITFAFSSGSCEPGSTRKQIKVTYKLKSLTENSNDINQFYLALKLRKLRNRCFLRMSCILLIQNEGLTTQLQFFLY